MDQTDKNSCGSSRESGGYINEAVICCDEPTDEADDLREEVVVDYEGAMGTSCDDPSYESDDIRKERVVHTEDIIMPSCEEPSDEPEDSNKETIVDVDGTMQSCTEATGTAATGTAATGTGPTSTGATGTAATGTGPTSTGATGTAATGTGPTGTTANGTGPTDTGATGTGPTDDIRRQTSVGSDDRIEVTGHTEDDLHREYDFPYMQNSIKLLQNLYRAARTKCQLWSKSLLENIGSSMPAIVAAISLILLNFDQVTDIWNSNKICQVQCECVWYSSDDQCNPATDSTLINHPCVTAKGDHHIARQYCNNVTTKLECNDLDSWSPTSPRHLQFCLSTIGTILVPNILISSYFLWILYPSVMRYIGAPDASHLFSMFIKIILLFLYILQLLPYAWFVMNFLFHFNPVKFKAFRELIVKDIWDKTSMRTKLIAIILEDMPQLVMNAMFIINSVLTDDNPEFSVGIYMLGTMTYLGIISSCASIALALTLFKGPPSANSTLIQFFTTLLSVGVRAFICASYAAAVDGFSPLSWPLLLPPLIAIGLSIIDYILFIFYKFVVDFRQSHLLRQTGIVKYLRDNSQSLYVWVTESDYSDYKVLMKRKASQMMISTITITFEANSAQSLITSYSYLAFAVVIDIASLSAWSKIPRGTMSMTQETFFALKHLAYASFLLNLLKVQWEGKDKFRCLAYSAIYLLFIGNIYIYAKNNFHLFYAHFSYLKTFYPTKTEKEALVSLYYAVIIAGIITSLDLLIVINFVQRGRRRRFSLGAV